MKNKNTPSNKFLAGEIPGEKFFLHRIHSNPTTFFFSYVNPEGEETDFELYDIHLGLELYLHLNIKIRSSRKEYAPEEYNKVTRREMSKKLEEYFPSAERILDKIAAVFYLVN